MKRILFFLPLLALVGACTAPEDAKRVVEQQGFTDVQTDGYAMWSCSDDEALDLST